MIKKWIKGWHHMRWKKNVIIIIYNRYFCFFFLLNLFWKFIKYWLEAFRVFLICLFSRLIFIMCQFISNPNLYTYIDISLFYLCKNFNTFIIFLQRWMRFHLNLFMNWFFCSFLNRANLNFYQHQALQNYVNFN